VPCLAVLCCCRDAPALAQRLALRCWLAALRGGERVAAAFLHWNAFHSLHRAVYWSVLYVLAAFLDVAGAVTAARRYAAAAEANALSQPLRGEAKEQQSWRPLRRAEEYESLLCCALYTAGGLLFLIGSVLYLPSIGLSNAGTLTFRAGSCAYISGSAVGAVRALQAPRVGQPAPQLNLLGLAALLQFVCGSSLFITGGACFQGGQGKAGAIAWLIGSRAFLTGSVTSVAAAGGGAAPEPAVAAECDEEQ
jgi:YrhK-like protein